jgi:RNA polymerase sigma-70 factor (ECF subfamily)
MLQDDIPDPRPGPGTIDEAIRSLSDADYLRLRKAAKYLSRPTRYTPEELLSQALYNALAGDRQYKPEINLISFLFMTMKSLVSSDCKSQSRHPTEISLDTQTHNTGKVLLEKLQDPYPSPENIAETEENVSFIKQTILDLFDDNLMVQTMVEGIMEEMPPKEIQELTGLDHKSYASARRLIRRRIDKAFPEGWNYE